MGTFNNLTASIQDHILRNVLAPAHITDSEQNRDALANFWLEKEKAFLTQLKEMGMEEVDSLKKDEPKGILGLTYSGSLIGIGPIEGDARRIIYSSIGMRTDVPDQAVSEQSGLDSDPQVDQELFVTSGPIKKSSPLYKLAVISNLISIEDQRETIDEATRIITEEMVDLNKTVVVE